VHDPRRGLPTEDPALVGRFSKGGRSTFVHVNHSAKQAMVHGFIDGRPNEGFAGAPGDELQQRARVPSGPLENEGELVQRDLVHRLKFAHARRIAQKNKP